MSNDDRVRAPGGFSAVRNKQPGEFDVWNHVMWAGTYAIREQQPSGVDFVRVCRGSKGDGRGPRDPAAGMLLELAKKLGLAPSDAVLVGRHPTKDLEAALPELLKRAASPHATRGEQRLALEEMARIVQKALAAWKATEANK